MGMQEVSFRSELRRGVNAFNLVVGAAVGIGAGILVYGGVALGVLSLFDQGSALLPAILTALGVFLFTTGLHTAVHAYYGWRFERGIRASRQGRHTRAERLLRVVERPGMSHYDEAGAARRALEESRAAQVGERSERQVTKN